MTNINAIGTESKCDICGKPYENTSKARPKMYCSDNCKNFSKHLHAMERHLLNIDFAGYNGNQIKGDIFTMLNTAIQCKFRKDVR